MSYVYSQYNGQNSISLYMLFPHVCTKLFMLSTNFWDSPRTKVRGYCYLFFQYCLATYREAAAKVRGAGSLNTGNQCVLPKWSLFSTHF